MFKIKDKNSVELIGKKYVPACTTVGSGNIFVGKARNKFVKEAVQTISDVIADGAKAYAGKPLVSTQPFGEVISLVTGAGETSAVTVTGHDYLGQKMVETITLNGTTAVSGKKAFKDIESITTAANVGEDVDLVTTCVVGLEFTAVSKDFILKNGAADATAAITAGAFTQTATSDDPRGVLSIAHASTGDEIDCVYNTTDYVNASGNGGLFGVPHYAG